MSEMRSPGKPLSQKLGRETHRCKEPKVIRAATSPSTSRARTSELSLANCWRLSLDQPVRRKTQGPRLRQVPILLFYLKEERKENHF
jgi:hypothetical protein